MGTSILEIKLTLKEIGNVDALIPWERNGNNFKTDKGWEGEVTFSLVEPSYYERLNIPDEVKTAEVVTYKIKGEQSQFAKSNISVLLRTLKTVCDAIKEHLSLNPKVQALVFMAAHKDPSKVQYETDPQKAKIYKAIIIAQMSKLGNGWTWREVEVDPSFNGFLLYKKTK